VAGKSLPVLTNLDKGRYGVIVFENLDKYLNMDKWNRERLCVVVKQQFVHRVKPGKRNKIKTQEIRRFV